MKQFSRTTVYIIVSFLIHLTILLYLPNPDFSIRIKKREPIDVELIKVPISVAKSELNIQEPEKGRSSVGNGKKNKPNSAGILKPNVDLPIVSVMEKIPVSNNLNENVNISANSNKNMNLNLGKEIAASESKLKSGKNEDSGNKKVVSTGKSDFFEIKGNTKNERRIVYIPEKPTFSLESNTKVRLRFSIDSNGVPYSIILLSRSNPDIEKLAIKFVSGIRFESVTYKDIDTAEITVYFNVR